jgi:hypothetical protein
MRGGELLTRYLRTGMGPSWKIGVILTAACSNLNCWDFIKQTGFSKQFSLNTYRSFHYLPQRFPSYSKLVVRFWGTPICGGRGQVNFPGLILNKLKSLSFSTLCDPVVFQNAVICFSIAEAQAGWVWRASWWLSWGHIACLPHHHPARLCFPQWLRAKLPSLILVLRSPRTSTPHSSFHSSSQERVWSS